MQNRRQQAPSATSAWTLADLLPEVCSSPKLHSHNYSMSEKGRLIGEFQY